MSPSLNDLLVPHSEKEFLEDILGNCALRVPGQSGKFDGLVSWRDLNYLLEFGGIRYPRLRLLRGGQEIREQDYVDTVTSGYPRLLVRELTDNLREGASLAVECFDDLNEPVSLLCESLENSIGVPVQADLYATWQDRPPAPIRWNEHDVLVLQIEGQRMWSLFYPTIGVGSDSEQQSHRELAWRGELAEGELLYVPQGWWYRDESSGTSALFIAIKFRNITASDALGAAVEKLRQDARTSLGIILPYDGNPAQKSAILRIIQAALDDVAGTPDMLAAAHALAQNSAPPRPRFSLPWSAEATPPTPTGAYLIGCRLRFPAAVQATHLESEEAFELIVDGKQFRFPERVFPLYELLRQQRVTTVRALLEGCANDAAQERLIADLSALVFCGVVWLKEPVPSRSLTSRHNA